jgi:hypothetical protein
MTGTKVSIRSVTSWTNPNEPGVLIWILKSNPHNNCNGFQNLTPYEWNDENNQTLKMKCEVSEMNVI